MHGVKVGVESPRREVQRLYLKGLVALLWAFAVNAPAVTASGTLPAASDLQADAEAARAQGAPILVFFSSAYCPYCHEVSELYLEPMYRRGDYGNRLLIRAVDVDSSRRLVDFDGQTTRMDAFAQREGTRFTPTIRIYGPDGSELANAIVGFTSREFFGGMLWDAIEHSISKLCGVADAPRAAPDATTRVAVRC